MSELFSHENIQVNRMRMRVPTMLIWGTEDKFLGREMAAPSVTRVNQLLKAFLPA